MQTARWSLIETVFSTAVGFIISFLLNIYALPLLGVVVSHEQNISMILLFTVASLVRQYVLRRFFNKVHAKLTEGEK